MSFPYIPFYVADYVSKAHYLSLMEHGAYLKLLMLCWETPGCSIPDDRDWIQRRLACSDSEYESAVQLVIAEFFESQKGRLSNRRLSEEYEKLATKYKTSKKNGKKGGRPAKVLKNKETEKAVGSETKTQTRHNSEPEPEPYTYTEVTDVTSDGAVAPLDMRTRLFREGLASIHRQTGRRENQCRAMLGKFLKLAYDDCEKVLNTILQAEQDRVASPEPWIIRVLQDRKGARQNTIELVAAEMMKNDQASTDRDGEETSAIDAFRRLAALN